MPEFIDILLETESEVCNRIADLCNERDQLAKGYELAFAQCVTVEDASALWAESEKRLDLIDREILIRSNALRKLRDQIGAMS